VSPENTSKSRNIYLKNCWKNENRKKVRVQKAQKVRKSQMEMSPLGITSVCPKKPQNHELDPDETVGNRERCPKKTQKMSIFQIGNPGDARRFDDDF